MAPNTQTVDRADLAIDDVTGLPHQLFVGNDKAFRYRVLEADRTPRDLTPDTLTVRAKAETTGNSLTFTFTPDPNQTTTGKGFCTLLCPAAALTATDQNNNILVDLIVNNRVLATVQIALVPSDAA